MSIKKSVIKTVAQHVTMWGWKDPINGTSIRDAPSLFSKRTSGTATRKFRELAQEALAKHPQMKTAYVYKAGYYHLRAWFARDIVEMDRAA